MKSFAPKPWVVPQPVLIIGTYSREGVANAMNAAWAGQWDMKEIMISMGNHVTTNNLKLGGEFTVAFATKKTMVAADFVGIVSARSDPKKMEKTGWSIGKATVVNAPVFIDFPMTLECRKRNWLLSRCRNSQYPCRREVSGRRRKSRHGEDGVNRLRPHSPWLYPAGR